MTQSPANPAPLLSVRGLKKYFPVMSKGFITKKINDIKAVDDVSFDLMPGETLGIVGESGSGKTTAARSVLRAITPTAGEVLFNLGDGKTVDLAKLTDQELKPLRKKMQMVFQDPFSSLNPRMTVKDIVSEPLLIHGMKNENERTQKVAEILVKVGLKVEHMNRYPHAFSGGQRQRIGIARALVLNPSLVVADEAVSALDVSVQAQVINLLLDLQAELKLTYIFVAHNLGVVRHICDRVAVMYAGRLVEIAPTEELFNAPKHPYTQALLTAVPHPDPDVPMKFDLQGEVADLSKLPPGCSFSPRCKQCVPACSTTRPILQATGAERQAACHLYNP